MQSTLSQLGHNTRSCELIQRDLIEKKRYRIWNEVKNLVYKIVELKEDPRETIVKVYDTKRAEANFMNKLYTASISNHKRKKQGTVNASDLHLAEQEKGYSFKNMQQRVHEKDFYLHS